MAESSKEGYGSKRAVLPMMMMMMVNIYHKSLMHVIYTVLQINLQVRFEI
jgi:hypothetical protein